MGDDLIFWSGIILLMVPFTILGIIAVGVAVWGFMRCTLSTRLG